MANYYVQPGEDIQDYIDLSTDGDLIVVYAGSYPVIDFSGKAITIRANTGDTVIIDGGDFDSTSCVTFRTSETSNSILDGFVIKNGNASHGPGIYCGATSPTIKNCTIQDNYASYGAPIYISTGANPVFYNCIIKNNQGTRGGVFYIWASSSPSFYNCLIYGNTASTYGAWYNNYGTSSCLFVNCTITGNTCTSSSYGGTHGSSKVGTFINCILWNEDVTTEIYDPYNDTVLFFCNIRGNWYGTGYGNINQDPLFFNSSDNNYSLSWNSPCIDIGSGNDSSGSFNLTGGTDRAIVGVTSPLEGFIFNSSSITSLTSIKIRVKKVAGFTDTDFVIFRLHDNIANAPGNILSSITKYGSDLSTIYKIIDLAFTYTLTADTDYWLTFEIDPLMSGLIVIDVENNGYVGGWYREGGANIDYQAWYLLNDSYSTSILSYDILENKREEDGDGDGVETVDIGAYEYFDPTLSTHTKYANLFMSLLPKGRAWTRDPDSFMYKLAFGLTREFARIETKIATLLNESYVTKTNELVSFHESDYGIPDNCTSLSDNLSDRRKALQAKMLFIGKCHKQYFLDIANTLGFTVVFIEHSPCWCGSAVCGDRCGAQENIYYTSVAIYYHHANYPGDALLSTMYCMFKKAVQAHRTLLWDWYGPEFDVSFSSAFNSMPFEDDVEYAFSDAFDSSFNAQPREVTEIWGGAFDLSFNPSFDRNYGVDLSSYFYGAFNRSFSTAFDTFLYTGNTK